MMRLRYRILLVITFFVTVAVALAVAGTVSIRAPKPQTVQVDGTDMTLEVADIASEREQGLSGREKLARNNGMLFVFEDSARRCFWMKDVLFPLDIIWLDSEKRIVEARHDVQPDSYPQTFCSEQPAQYVVEVNAGRAEELGFRAGKALSF